MGISFNCRLLLIVAFVLLLSCTTAFSLIKVTSTRCWSNVDAQHRSGINRISLLSTPAAASTDLEQAPFDDIIPFLSEHIQPSDQLLFVGASTDMALQLVRAGYGRKKTGFMVVVDSNEANIQACEDAARSDETLASVMKEGRLKFAIADLTEMPEICKQSSFDSIVDYGGLDALVSGPTGPSGMIKCIDHLQNAVRLGNILVCLSKLDKDTFCSPFEERFGWVQELDGEPGEISAWYRGKTNIEATTSNFARLGLKMYVYTNTDNC